MKAVLLRLYSAIFFWASVLLRPLVVLVPSENARQKLDRMFEARRGLLARLRAFREAVPGDLWWFHVASAGELEQAIPLMESVRARHPDCVLYLSFFSPSAEHAAKTEAQRRRQRQQPKAVPWDYADYLCWDYRLQVRPYVELLAPAHFVTLHAELWPVLFSELERKSVPISLGAVFVPEAERLGIFKRVYYRAALSPVTRIATVDEHTTRRLQREFPQKDIQMLGDPRIDRVLERAKVAGTREGNGAQRRSGGVEVALASIHDEDWEALAPWLSHFGNKRHAVRLWIVPHDLDSKLMNNIESRLRSLGLPFSRVSQGKERASLSEVVLVDEVGHLAELYARVDVTYVGGSFAKAVHNVLEPAVYGVAIVTGPRIERSCEAVEMLGCGALQKSDTPAMLSDALDAMLTNDRYREETGERATRFLVDRSGVSGRYGKWLNVRSDYRYQ